MDDIDRVQFGEAAARCLRCGKTFEAADQATAWRIAAVHQRTCRDEKRPTTHPQ